MKCTSGVLVVSLLAAMLLAPSVQAKEAGKGWLTYTDLKKALELAATKDVPVCILYQFREEIDSGHDARARVFEVYPHFNGTIRVCIHCEYTRKMDRETTHQFHELYGRIDSMIVPMVFFTDGDGHLIGYAGANSPSNKWAQAAKTAKGICAWKKKSRAAIEKIKKAITGNNFNLAASELKRIAKEDAKMTAVAENSYPHEPPDLDDSKKPSEMTDEEKEALRIRKARLARQFFYDPVDELTTKLQETIKLEYAKAEALKAEGKLTEALQALRCLVTCKADPEMAKKAKRLQADIIAAIKEARDNAKAGGSTPAPSADSPS